MDGIEVREVYRKILHVKLYWVHTWKHLVEARDRPKRRFSFCFLFFVFRLVLFSVVLGVVLVALGTVSEQVEVVASHYCYRS